MNVLTANKEGLRQYDRSSGIKGQSGMPAEVPVVMLTLWITGYGNKEKQKKCMPPHTGSSTLIFL